MSHLTGGLKLFGQGVNLGVQGVREYFQTVRESGAGAAEGSIAVGQPDRTEYRGIKDGFARE